MKALWVLTMLVATAIVFTTGRSAVRAHADAQRAKSELTTVCRQASELVRLRMQSQEEALPPKPATGLASQVSAALTRCGLPASTLQSLSPEAQTATGSASIRQRATLNLTGLTLPQLGAFLGGWRGGGGEYAVSSIDLSPVGPGGAAPPPPPGADLPLRAVLILEGMFRESAAIRIPLLSPTSAGTKP